MDFEIRNPLIPEFFNSLRKRRLNFGNPFIGDQTGKTKRKEEASKPPHQNHNEVLCEKSEGSH
jgi:hypothetical protein